MKDTVGFVEILLTWCVYAVCYDSYVYSVRVQGGEETLEYYKCGEGSLARVSHARLLRERERERER